MSLAWQVETAAGGAAQLLSDPMVARRRAVRLVAPDDRAVVLGSTQPGADIDGARAAAAGIAVLRRRSGGGAVLVGPGQVLWTDVVIPAGDPLWTVDVGRAFWWLGELWAEALSAVGLTGATVWRGGLVRTPWSGRICFAGLGPGEVTVGLTKVVGLSQRRTRTGACFQCAVPMTWQPAELLAVMALDDETRLGAQLQLAEVAMGVGRDVAARVMAEFLDRLP